MRYLLVLALLTAGCASRQQVIWLKDNMSNYERDNYECTREASFVYRPTGNVDCKRRPITCAVDENQQGLKVDTNLHSMCMKARGYTPTSQEQRKQWAARVIDNFGPECVKLGFERGTDAWYQCLLYRDRENRSLETRNAQ